MIDPKEIAPQQEQPLMETTPIEETAVPVEAVEDPPLQDMGEDLGIPVDSNSMTGEEGEVISLSQGNQDIFNPNSDLVKIPDEEEAEGEKHQMKSQEAGTEAFYVVAKGNLDVLENPEQALEQFKEVKDSLMAGMPNELVDAVISQASEEDDESYSLAIESIIKDPTLDKDFKRTILEGYLTSGYIRPSFRNMFIDQQIVRIDGVDSTEEEEQKERVIDNLPQLKKELTNRTHANNLNKIETGWWSELGEGLSRGAYQTLLQLGNNDLAFSLGFGVTDQEVMDGRAKLKGWISESLGGIGPLLGGSLVPMFIFGSNPAGIALAATVGLLAQATSRYSELGGSVKDHEERLRAAISSGIMFGLDMTLPIHRTAFILKNMITNSMGNIVIGEVDIKLQNEILGAFPEVQQEQFNIKGMTVNGLMGVVVALVAGRKPVPKMANELPPDSAINTIDLIDKKEAADVSVEQITGNTGNESVTEALNGGKGLGELLHDWYLADWLPADRKGDAPIHADLRARLDEKVKIFDNKFRRLYQIFRYDPNVVNATERFEDMKVIFDVLKASNAPYYQQSNSYNKFNFTNEVSEGSSVFGPKNGGTYATEVGATRQMNKLKKTIDLMDEADRGILKLVGDKKKGYHIQWDWQKTYDPLTLGVFGKEAIHTKVLGVDVSGLARTLVGKWLFPYGRNRAAEQGAFRGIERGSLLEQAFLKEFSENVMKSPHKRELNDLIEEAEMGGIDYFSPQEISTRSPHLSTAQVDDLFVSWTMWRRIQDVSHNFTNRQMRNKLASEGFEGVFDVNGQSMGIVNAKITDDELRFLADKVKYGDAMVWDYSTGKAIRYKPKILKKEGKILVKMKDPVKGEGKSYEYGVVGDGVKLDFLPIHVVPRVAGYSPRKTKENWFIDMFPKAYNINGRVVKNIDELRNKLKTTRAATRTNRDAETMKAELERTNPDMIVEIRRERLDTVERIAEDMQIRGEMLQEAKRRGDRLPSIDGGFARLEDRLITAMDSVRTLANIEAFTQWDNAFQKSFMDSYGDMVKGEDFPTVITQIEPAGAKTRENEIRYKDALALYDYYHNQKVIGSWEDDYWKNFMFHIADLIEDLPEGKYIDPVVRFASDKTRRLGEAGNIIYKYPKAVVTAAFIHLSPVRQWLIQPAQLREMYFVYPENFPSAIADTFAIRAAIMGKSPSLSRWEKTFTKIGKKSKRMSDKEFDETLEALIDSGIIESIDKNMLVTGMFHDAKTPLVESGKQATLRKAKNAALGGLRKSREIGFDFAELTNRIGMYLQVKAIWRKQNPTKDWRTLENREIIAFEAIKLSGGMSKAGNLPYQKGILSVFLQFSAINHKLTMNLFQDNATILSPSDRARVGAVRLALYGTTYGLPLGMFLENAMDKLIYDPLFADNPENRNTFKRGWMDYFSNKIAAPFIDPDVPSDLLVSKGQTPYSEHGLPIVTLVSEMLKLADGQPASNPRFPALAIGSSLKKTYNEMEGWFVDKKMDTPEQVGRILLEAAEIASVGNNATKGYLILAMRDSTTSKGAHSGTPHSKAEAYAMMIAGVQSAKSVEQYDMIRTIAEHKQDLKDIADDLYLQMVNVQTKSKPEQFSFQRKFSSYMTAIQSDQFSRTDRLKVMEMILQKYKYAQRTTGSSIIAELYKHNVETLSEEMESLVEQMKRSNHKGTRDAVEQWENRFNPEEEL